MAPGPELSTDGHFHIRWHPASPTNRLDWEAFATVEEAKTRAAELARPEEKFEIEQYDGECPKCGPKTMHAG